MSRIANQNTSPELIVRSVLHRMGLRFRLHRKDLPGKPDIVLPKYNTVIFVHGCFWHNHKKCVDGHTPKSNSDFWQQKFERNKARDLRQKKALRILGWRVLIIWECETKLKKILESRLKKMMIF